MVQQLQAVDDLLFPRGFSCKNQPHLVFCCRNDPIPTPDILHYDEGHVLLTPNFSNWGVRRRQNCPYGLLQGVFYQKFGHFWLTLATTPLFFTVEHANPSIEMAEHGPHAHVQILG